MRHYDRLDGSGSGCSTNRPLPSAHQTQLPHARHPPLEGDGIVNQMNQLYRRSPFVQRRRDDEQQQQQRANGPEAIYSNLGELNSQLQLLKPFVNNN